MSYPGEYHSVEIGHMVKRRVKSLSRVRLLVTPWTIAYQASQTMGFSRQEYWSGLPFPSPGDLLDPGIKPGSPALQTDTLSSEPPGKPTALKQLFNKWLVGPQRIASSKNHLLLNQSAKVGDEGGN